MYAPLIVMSTVHDVLHFLPSWGTLNLSYFFWGTYSLLLVIIYLPLFSSFLYHTDPLQTVSQEPLPETTRSQIVGNDSPLTQQGRSWKSVGSTTDCNLPTRHFSLWPKSRPQCLNIPRSSVSPFFFFFLHTTIPVPIWSLLTTRFYIQKTIVYTKKSLFLCLGVKNLQYIELKIFFNILCALYFT